MTRDSQPSTPATSPGDALPPRVILGHVVAWLAILAALVYMLSAGWERWNDPVVDFGRELYLPWRITQGEVMYRDLASFNGPLSPYINALWFQLFGVSLHTLIYANIAIALAIIAMIYRLASLTAGTCAAAAASLTFIFISGFSQFGAYGNENYLAPYSHETTHGIALCLAALLLLHRFLKRPSLPRLAITGFFVGLVFLTKVEIFVAISLAIGIGWGLHAWRARTPSPSFLKQAGTLLAASLAPPLIAFLLLACAMPARDALQGTLGSLAHSFNARLTTNVYFQEVTGLGEPMTNLGRAALMMVAIALTLGMSALAGWRTRGAGVQQAIVAAVVFAVIAGALGYWQSAVPWPDLSRSLTPWVVVIAACWLVLIVRRSRTQPADPLALLALAWTIFAGATLLKMILNVRLNHYGFALAMPALTLFVVAVFGWWPRILSRLDGSAVVMRAGAAGALLIFVMHHVQLSNANHSQFVVPIASGPDRFLFHRVGTRSDDVVSLLKMLAENTHQNETIAVMPEGVMVNYLLRRENPSKYTFYEPSDVMMFGEDKILASFVANPPDYVVYIHKDTSQFGVRYFGQDYAQKMHAWVLANYNVVGRIGPPPFTSPDGGILVFARKR